jgi:hypothetical protein
MDTVPKISTLASLKLKLKSRMEKNSSIKTVGSKISDLRDKIYFVPTSEQQVITSDTLENNGEWKNIPEIVRNALSSIMCSLE